MRLPRTRPEHSSVFSPFSSLPAVTSLPVSSKTSSQSKSPWGLYLSSHVICTIVSIAQAFKEHALDSKSTHNFISYSSSLISPSAFSGHLLWTRPNAGPACAEMKGPPLPWRDFASFCLFLLLSTGTKLPTPQSMFHTYVSQDPQFKGFKIK